MLLSPRKNGLTSLFKEVRVFKEMSAASSSGGAVQPCYVVATQEKKLAKQTTATTRKAKAKAKTKAKASSRRKEDDDDDDETQKMRRTVHWRNSSQELQCISVILTSLAVSRSR